MRDKTTLPPTVDGFNWLLPWLSDFQRAHWCTRTANTLERYTRSRGTSQGSTRIRNEYQKKHTSLQSNSRRDAQGTRIWTMVQRRTRRVTRKCVGGDYKVCTWWLQSDYIPVFKCVQSALFFVSKIIQRCYNYRISYGNYWKEFDSHFSVERRCKDCHLIADMAFFSIKSLAL